jgi:hypothetical protein
LRPLVGPVAPIAAFRIGPPSLVRSRRQAVSAARRTSVWRVRIGSPCAHDADGSEVGRASTAMARERADGGELRGGPGVRSLHAPVLGESPEDEGGCGRRLGLGWRAGRIAT